jgi:cytochrome c oxidase subunit 2
MAIAIALILLVIGSVLFHLFNPWWLTPLASHWKTMDDTVLAAARLCCRVDRTAG